METNEIKEIEIIPMKEKKNQNLIDIYGTFAFWNFPKLDFIR
jgi:hypothetical protein